MTRRRSVADPNASGSAQEIINRTFMPRCKHCIGIRNADTLVEDLCCPVHGIEAQGRAQKLYPGRQEWLDALAETEGRMWIRG
jgi:hypothetical protein